jgi:hypothetical protein
LSTWHWTTHYHCKQIKKVPVAFSLDNQKNIKD